MKKQSKKQNKNKEKEKKFIQKRVKFQPRTEVQFNVSKFDASTDFNRLSK